METKRPDIEEEKLGVPPEPPPGPPRRLLKDGEIPRRLGDGYQPSTSTTDPKNPPSGGSGVPALPLVQRIEVLELRPDDTLVVSYQQRLSAAETRRIYECLQPVLRGAKCVLLDNGAELSVLREAP